MELQVASTIPSHASATILWRWTVVGVVSTLPRPHPFALAGNPPGISHTCIFHKYIFKIKKLKNSNERGQRMAGNGARGECSEE